jgi:hypothetical protein
MRRFICPHCHSPVDPQTMDAASTDDVVFRICPFCDGPVLLAPCAAEADGRPSRVCQPAPPVGEVCAP